MAELTGMGDSLRGERIAVEASAISSPMVQKRSGAHKGQFATLTRNAYCVIEMPLKWVLNKRAELSE
jgi:hypothetical protein